MTSGYARNFAGWVKHYFQQREIVQVAHLSSLDLRLYLRYAVTRIAICTYIMNVNEQDR